MPDEPDTQEGGGRPAGDRGAMPDPAPRRLVETWRDGHVLVVALCRPEKRNAVDRALADAIDAALNELDDDPDLWVGVLTATGTVFSAGSDLHAAGDYVTTRGGEYGVVRRRRRKPLIAAVEGPALGGGLEIVLSCDLVVASTTARFGLPEVVIGLVPSCGALFRAPRAVPLNLAKEMVLTGAPLSAARAHAAGMVNELTEPGRALDGALRLARRICANSPLAVQACLAAMNDAVADADEVGWAATRRAKESVSTTADAGEGVRAFFERRPPVWSGR
jgi:enoyl-CoA hydratase/carnithine racemase